MGIEINWRGILILSIIISILVYTLLYTIIKIINAGVKHMLMLACFLIGLCIGLGKNYVKELIVWGFGRLKHNVKDEIGMKDSETPAPVVKKEGE